MENRICKVCNKILPNGNKRFCSMECYKKILKKNPPSNWKEERKKVFVEIVARFFIIFTVEKKKEKSFVL
jgi:predicted nucleic acid-binding Zn ribbon protein